MKKIITALDNSDINEELKKYYEVLCKDISYKEGVLEQIEFNRKIDLIIINEQIDGTMELKFLIKKIKETIKKIEIIIITNKKEKISSDLKRYKRIKYYECNKIKVKKLLQLIENESVVEEEETIRNENIINFYGNNGVGKTVTSIIFSKLNVNSNNLLVEFNQEENHDISMILNKKSLNQLQKINDNLNLLSTCKEKKLKQILNKEKYTTVFIDLGNNIEEKDKILKYSKFNIILIEPNIIGIKKAKIIINEYLTKKIKKEKILILINKKNKNSIDKKIIKNIFKEFKIIGELKLNNQYDKLINNGFKNINIILSKQEKNNIRKILKKIEK